MSEIHECLTVLCPFDHVPKAAYCRIDLDGSYEPPLGLAGAVFDSVLGHHIAVAAAGAA
jgi:hypothetical protein